MDASHIVDVEEARDISTDQTNNRPEEVNYNSSCRDSMVSVRLSVSEPYVPEDVAHRPTATAVHYQTNLDEYAVEEPIDQHIDDHDQLEKTGAAEDVSSRTHEHRASVASSSVPSCGDEGASASTVRSRSNSSTTASSSNSTPVDWDELERSEEQEPRDEGSDEVRSTYKTHLDS